jgi:hypothetical protein
MFESDLPALNAVERLIYLEKYAASRSRSVCGELRSLSRRMAAISGDQRNAVGASSALGNPADQFYGLAAIWSSTALRCVF